MGALCRGSCRPFQLRLLTHHHPKPSELRRPPWGIMYGQPCSSNIAAVQSLSGETGIGLAPRFGGADGVQEN